MAKFSELVDLRELTWAIHFAFEKEITLAVQAVENVLNEFNEVEGTFEVNTFQYDGNSFELVVDDEIREELAVNFFNANWWNVDVSYVNYVDEVAIERTKAETLPYFKSRDDFSRCFLAAQRKILEVEREDSIKLVDQLNALLIDQNDRPLYNIHLMKIAIEVQKKYWPQENSNPKQETVIYDIRKEYNLSDAEAKAVERVACPRDRKKL